MAYPKDATIHSMKSQAQFSFSYSIAWWGYFFINFPESTPFIFSSFEELGEILSLAHLKEVDHQEKGKRLPTVCVLC